MSAGAWFGLAGLCLLVVDGLGRLPEYLQYRRHVREGRRR